jgi:hypothetical protein
VGYGRPLRAGDSAKPMAAFVIVLVVSVIGREGAGEAPEWLGGPRVLAWGRPVASGGGLAVKDPAETPLGRGLPVAPIRAAPSA